MLRTRNDCPRYSIVPTLGKSRITSHANFVTDQYSKNFVHCRNKKTENKILREKFLGYFSKVLGLIFKFNCRGGNAM